MNYNKFFTIIVIFISSVAIFFIFYISINNSNHTEKYSDIILSLTALASSMCAAVVSIISRRRHKETLKKNRLEQLILSEYTNKNMSKIRFMEKYNDLSNKIEIKYNLNSSEKGRQEDPIIYQLQKYQDEGNLDMRDYLKEILATRNFIVHEDNINLDKKFISGEIRSIEKISQTLDKIN